MQTRQQTWFEVGIDVILSLLVNIVAQSLVYGALATVSRSVTFASLVLGLATLRRYATRRLFNAKLLTDGPQSRLQSWLEVSTDTAIGLIVAILLQGVFYGAAATWSKAGGLTTVVYAIALGRRYLLRRFFETRNTRQRAQSLYHPSAAVFLIAPFTRNDRVSTPPDPPAPASCTTEAAGIAVDPPVL